MMGCLQCCSTALMREGSIAVNAQNIPAWFVQTPKFFVAVSFNPAAFKPTSEIEHETSCSRLGMNLDRDKFLTIQVAHCSVDLLV